MAPSHSGPRLCYFAQLPLGRLPARSLSHTQQQAPLTPSSPTPSTSLRPQLLAPEPPPLHPHTVTHGNSRSSPGTYLNPPCKAGLSLPQLMVKTLISLFPQRQPRWFSKSVNSVDLLSCPVSVGQFSAATECLFPPFLTLHCKTSVRTCVCVEYIPLKSVQPKISSSQLLLKENCRIELFLLV